MLYRYRYIIYNMDIPLYITYNVNIYDIYKIYIYYICVFLYSGESNDLTDLLCDNFP